MFVLDYIGFQPIHYECFRLINVHNLGLKNSPASDHPIFLRLLGGLRCIPVFFSLDSLWMICHPPKTDPWKQKVLLTFSQQQAHHVINKQSHLSVLQRMYPLLKGRVGLPCGWLITNNDNRGSILSSRVIDFQAYDLHVQRIINPVRAEWLALRIGGETTIVTG